MTITTPLRRQLLAMLCGVVLAATAHAQAWPNKPVRIVVPTGAGSAPDVVARLVGDKLATLWGQGVVVDNKPGAGGIPGMSNLARSPADGYTLGFVPAAMGTITPLVFRNPQFNPDTELQSVATVGTSPLLIVTPTSSGITSLADLAKRGQAAPGKINFAAAQLNSLPHLAGELMNKSGNMQLFTVPYPTPPAAITATLAGDATVTADGIPSLVPHIKGGKLRALAVTSARRVPGFDDIPAVAETYPGYEALGWFQILVPAGTPQAVVDKVNRDVNSVTQQADVIARLNELGIFPRQDSVAQAREFFAAQQRAMRKLVADLGIQPQ